MIRSLLYTPGDRPDRMRSALELEGDDAPDVLILDLEDGVALSAKVAARQHIVEFVGEVAGREGIPQLRVRCNSGSELELDVVACGDLPVAGWVLPKATSATVTAFIERISRSAKQPAPVSALIESAQGVLDAPAIARTDGVAQLQLGEADLAADLNLRPSDDGREFASVRSQIVVAAAAAGIAPPVGPVSTEFRDLDALRVSTEQLRRMGFGSRSVIHPAQVSTVNAAFTPSDDELEAAAALVSAYDEAVAGGSGVVAGPDGRMLDEAVVRSARRLLDS